MYVTAHTVQASNNQYTVQASNNQYTAYIIVIQAVAPPPYCVSASSPLTVCL